LRGLPLSKIHSALKFFASLTSLGPGAITTLYSFFNSSCIIFISSLKYGHFFSFKCGEQNGNKIIYFLSSNLELISDISVHDQLKLGLRVNFVFNPRSL